MLIELGRLRALQGFCKGVGVKGLSTTGHVFEECRA